MSLILVVFFSGSWLLLSFFHEADAVDEFEPVIIALDVCNCDENYFSTDGDSPVSVEFHYALPLLAGNRFAFRTEDIAVPHHCFSPHEHPPKA
ncbi:MAG TPA: hypothetical protein VK448_10615 [Dissulfurispiraceae bacterium]|nr:hypothetical protein [Thermodesulfovibrionales bacterium]HMK57077.1 hypothetical protein [Dissulfurispiraceae bacterium]